VPTTNRAGDIKNGIFLKIATILKHKNQTANNVYKNKITASGNSNVLISLINHSSNIMLTKKLKIKKKRLRTNIFVNYSSMFTGY